MILETRRLILRNFIRADIPLYAAVCASKDAPPDPEERARGYIAAAACDPRLDFRMAVLDRRDGGLLGSAGIRLHGADSRTAMFSCEMARDHRQQGLGFEAAEAVIDMAFRELSLENISATTTTSNEAAVRLLYSLGMHPVSGTVSGSIGDTVMSLSRRDWFRQDS